MSNTMVNVPTDDGVADAYYTRPDGEGPFPGVLLYMDAFGLRPRLYEMADRIAEHGYAVLVPNLLYRAGSAPLVDLSGMMDPEKRGAIFGQIMPFIQALDTAAIIRDSRAYLDFLDGQEGVAAGPDAVVGYCMGGTNGFKAIEAFPDRLAALASFHGARLASDQPDSPHLQVGRITGEVYFAHADNDSSMPQESIDLLESALDAADVRFRSEIYRGAQHGFTMADTAAYDAEAEKRHWEKLFELLGNTFS
jgi:carboxymethylenebutenolidase